MRQAILNICLVAIALSLFKTLIPETSMKKQTDFLVACFFTASLLFLFTKGGINLAANIDFSAEETAYADFGERYAETQKRAIGVQIKERIGGVLAAEGIYPDEIYTVVNISNKYSISINEIRLVFRTGSDETVMETVKKAVAVAQKEVGDSILVSGELK